MLRRGDSTHSAIDALIGSEGYVMREVTPSGGRIRLADGEVWSARLSPITEQAAVPIGASVLVTGVDGATAVVVAIERSTDA
jgi:membrane protein implicated in regulation of membrane protease activity